MTYSNLNLQLTHFRMKTSHKPFTMFNLHSLDAEWIIWRSNLVYANEFCNYFGSEIISSIQLIAPKYQNWKIGGLWWVAECPLTHLPTILNQKIPAGTNNFCNHIFRHKFEFLRPAKEKKVRGRGVEVFL